MEDAGINPITKVGDRIKITDVPGAISNVKVSMSGVVISEARKVNNWFEVEIRLDDGQVIIWKEVNLKVVSDRSSEIVVAEIVDSQKIASKLEELETRIARGLRAALYEIGSALKEIKSSQLYKELGYKSFDAYCQERWGWQRTYAYYQIQAAEVIENLSGEDVHNCEQFVLSGQSEIPMPTTESQTRALAKYDPEIQPIIWSRAVEEAQGKPTAKIVKKVAKEVAKEMESGQIETGTEIERIEEEKPDRAQASKLELPDVGDICIIQAGDESELRAYQGFWGVVAEVGEVTCTVEVYDRILELVRVENLERIEVSAEDKESAIALMGRLRKIATAEPVDRMINGILIELSKRRDFGLSPREERILAFVEAELNIREDLI